MLGWISNLDFAAGAVVTATSSAGIATGKVDKVYLEDYRDIVV